MSAEKIRALIEAHERGDERPVAEIREEHYDRIHAALTNLHTPKGMADWLVARYLKAGEGSATNFALMAWQAPGELVENHYGWVEIHATNIPKGCKANVYLSNGRALPVAAWSERHLGLPPDYMTARFGVEPPPTICSDYAAMLAESWEKADPKGRPMTRVKALNAWVQEVEPKVVRAETTAGDREPVLVADDIPF